MKKFLHLMVLAILLARPGISFGLSESGFETLNIFTKILHYVESDYVETVDEKKLLQGAIRGMLNVLDPHTVYLSPAIYKNLRDDTAGVFGGVGIEITVRDGWITIVSPIEGSPAAQAGLKPGDRILKIDNKSTKGMDLGLAVKDMRGKNGSKVDLMLSRKGSKAPFNVSLVRRDIHAPSVRVELLEKKYLYVKIASFQERTAQDLRSALKKYVKEVEKSGMILDMRNNPGGLLDQAVQITDLFLDSGVIVTTASKKGEIDRKEATPNDFLDIHFPLIVLVNAGSASASEIVAGALQDHGRAVIMGTKTFGKGSVQSVIELDDGSALKMTIARYFTPKGRSIQADGVDPDIVVDPAPPGQAEGQGLLRLREEYLEGHLEGTKKPTAKKEEESDLQFDHQKLVALNYLKSWDVFHQTSSGGQTAQQTAEQKRTP